MYRFLRPRSCLWSIQKRTCYKFKRHSWCEPSDELHKTPLTHKFCKLPVPFYGGRFLVTMMTGGGIGPELMEFVYDIYDHAFVPVDFEYIEVRSMEDVDHAILSMKRNRAALKSNVENVTGKAEEGSPNVAIRQTLDLYLNVVHCKSFCGLPKARYKDIDIVLLRQNTEGEYLMLEHESVQGVVESLKIITRRNSERIVKCAFEFAVMHNRKKVTVVHKANIMKYSDGLFLEQARLVAKKFPDIKLESMLVDNCCMQLVAAPHQFDVLVMPNLYGSILSNILCGLAGGPGLFAGCNYGDNYAVFEPATRNMGTDLVGKNIVNPITMLVASVELLYHLGLVNYAHLIDKAIYKTICEDNIQTPDLGGTNTSTDIIKGITKNIDVYRAVQDF